MKTFSCILLTVTVIITIKYLMSCRDKKPGIFAHTGYHIAETKVFYNPGFTSGQPFELEDVDLQSFESLDSEGFPEGTYGKDQAHVYYNGKFLPGADAESFRRLKGYYSKDDLHIFYMSSKISDDPSHFEFLGDYVARDNRHVYFSDRIISDDPKGFKILGTDRGITYYRDALGIIANDSRIPYADADSFEILSAGYSRDAKSVFLRDGTIVLVVSDADPASFQILNDFYTKDKNQVYWRGEVIADADPATFEILNAEVHCSYDKKRAYIRNLPIPNADPRNFPVDKKCKYCTESEVVFEK